MITESIFVTCVDVVVDDKLIVVVDDDRFFVDGDLKAHFGGPIFNITKYILSKIHNDDDNDNDDEMIYRINKPEKK